MELKKYIDKNKIKSYILIIIGFFLISFGSYLFYQSYALYEEAKEFNVINGNVEDPGDIYFAYYIDGEISREMPRQNTGYTLDEEKSNCNNGVIPTWDNAGWKFIGDYHNYNGTVKTRTKCNLYFNKTSKTVSTVLGNIEVNSYSPDFTKSACDDEICESHEKGIFETTDYDGNPTYYYRGSVENNYVKFANFYWRIIRINSNGSIRIIYDGTSAHSNGESSTDRQTGTSKFNTGYNNNMYVGYMYTKDELHGITTSSTIKTNVDKFYASSLNAYASKMDNNIGYCGDRSPLNLLSGVGTGTVTTYYKGYLRVEENTPTLTCENMGDYYTVSNASIGNKALSYPIGLITADEVILAGYTGGIFDGTYNHQTNNPSVYLSSGIRFWTMTPAGSYNPFGFTTWVSFVLFVHHAIGIDDNTTSNNYGIRPVINIRSDVKVTGSGTMIDPYVVNG